MRNLDDLIRRLAENSSRAEIMEVLDSEAAATERVMRRRQRVHIRSDQVDKSQEAQLRRERIHRILFFLHHHAPAQGATDADMKLYDLLNERLRSRGEW
ncbi:MAG TPA: hypothetical protein VGF53_09615 [Pseudolabrys sp.]|jgi:hypothetical protein